MVKFDSAKRTLELGMIYNHIQGGAATQTKLVLDLSKLDELSRQLVVQAAKLGSCLSSNQQLLGSVVKRVDKEGNEIEISQQLPGDKLQNIINRIVDIRSKTSSSDYAESSSNLDEGKSA